MLGNGQKLEKFGANYRPKRSGERGKKRCQNGLFWARFWREMGAKRAPSGGSRRSRSRRPRAPKKVARSKQARGWPVSVAQVCRQRREAPPQPAFPRPSAHARGLTGGGPVGKERASSADVGMGRWLACARWEGPRGYRIQVTSGGWEWAQATRGRLCGARAAGLAPALRGAPCLGGRVTSAWAGWVVLEALVFGVSPVWTGRCMGLGGWRGSWPGNGRVIVWPR